MHLIKVPSPPVNRPERDWTLEVGGHRPAAQHETGTMGKSMKEGKHLLGIHDASSGHMLPSQAASRLTLVPTIQ